MMKKIINFRFLFFLSVIIGALVLGICEIFRQNYFWGILSLIVFGAGALFVVFSENHKTFTAITLIISIVGAISAISAFCFWEGKDQKGEIIFTLTDQIYHDPDEITAIGKDIKVNGQKIKGKVQVYIALDNPSYLYNLRAGDKLLIYQGELSAISLKKSESVDNYVYHENIKYVLVCKEFDVRRYGGKPDILSSIRYRIKDIIFGNMPDQDAAGISYAMITGNRDFISSDIYRSYKTAGLAHILAVSGMNVSFLILCLSLITLKLKGKRVFKLVFLSVFIVFYCALCGFVPSVSRAGIMGIIMVICKTFGFRLDSLNSLGFAALVMLIIRPLYIYDLSFLLSFASMFSIICLYPPLAKLFEKALKGKLGGKIAQILAMTLSANIGVYPLMAGYFNSLSTYSLIANLVLLPLINVIFIALFSACVAAMILPFLEFLVVPTGWMLAFTNAATKFLSGLPYAEFIIFSLGGFYVLYYVIVFVLGGFVNVGKKPKALVSLILTAVLALSMVFSNKPSVFAQDFYTAYSIPYSSAGLAVYDNAKYFVGEINRYNYPKIRKELIKQRIRKVDYVIIVTPPRDPEALIDFCEDFSVQKIALVTDDWSLCDEIKVRTKKEVIQIFDGINYKINDIEIYSYSYKNKRLGTSVLISGKKFLYPLVKDPEDLEILNTLSFGCDVLVCGEFVRNIDYLIFLIYDCDIMEPNIINLKQSDNYTFLL